MWNKFFQRLLSISTCYFFTFFARIKGYDNGRSHPALFPYFTTQSYICYCPAPEKRNNFSSSSLPLGQLLSPPLILIRFKFLFSLSQLVTLKCNISPGALINRRSNRKFEVGLFIAIFVVRVFLQPTASTRLNITEINSVKIENRKNLEFA